MQIATVAAVLTVIAEVKSVGGFRRYVGADGVRVYSDGSVTEFQDYYDKPDVESVIARIEAPQLEGLQKEIEPITLADLVDAEPDAPVCVDAPVTSYVVHNEAGEVALKRQAECHEFKRDDGAGYQVLRVLDGFLALSQVN